MLWRYQTGEDLEEMSKATRQISEEELKKMKDGALVVVEGQKRFIDEILTRKKLKQSYEFPEGNELIREHLVASRRSYQTWIQEGL